MKKTNQQTEMENPLYHDTWMLLRKYRDVVWSLELSVQQVRRQFQIEFGSSIERSYKMLKLIENAVNLLRSKHKFGETYYWILYYTYLSPQQYKNTEEIIELLQPHIQDISYRTYFRKRKEAIESLSSVLWGYTSRDSLNLLEQFFPENEIGRYPA